MSGHLEFPGGVGDIQSIYQGVRKLEVREVPVLGCAVQRIDIDKAVVKSSGQEGREHALSDSRGLELFPGRRMEFDYQRLGTQGHTDVFVVDVQCDQRILEAAVYPHPDKHHFSHPDRAHPLFGYVALIRMIIRELVIVVSFVGIVELVVTEGFAVHGIQQVVDGDTFGIDVLFSLAVPLEFIEEHHLDHFRNFTDPEQFRFVNFAAGVAGIVHGVGHGTHVTVTHVTRQFELVDVGPGVTVVGFFGLVAVGNIAAVLFPADQEYLSCIAALHLYRFTLVGFLVTAVVILPAPVASEQDTAFHDIGVAKLDERRHLQAGPVGVGVPDGYRQFERDRIGKPGLGIGLLEQALVRFNSYPTGIFLPEKRHLNRRFLHVDKEVPFTGAKRQRDILELTLYQNPGHSAPDNVVIEINQTLVEVLGLGIGRIEPRLQRDVHRLAVLQDDARFPVPVEGRVEIAVEPHPERDPLIGIAGGSSYVHYTDGLEGLVLVLRSGIEVEVGVAGDLAADQGSYFPVRVTVFHKLVERDLQLVKEVKVAERLRRFIQVLTENEG